MNRSPVVVSTHRQCHTTNQRDIPVVTPERTKSRCKISHQVRGDDVALKERIRELENTQDELRANIHVLEEQLVRAKCNGLDGPASRANEEKKKLLRLEEQCMRLQRQKSEDQERIKQLEDKVSLLERRVAQSEHVGDNCADISLSIDQPSILSPASRSTIMGHQDMDCDLEIRVNEALNSRDPRLMRNELLQLANRSLHQREHNARLLNRILSIQGNVQVCCRIRPIQETLSRRVKVAAEPLSETEVGCFDHKTKLWKSYAFDKVWGPDQRQQEVFQDVEPLALSVVEGYNACIFAYGQTGSGKTFTMEGTNLDNQYGISQRIVQKIFHLLNLREQQTKSTESSHKVEAFKFSIEVEMLEIYNEDVFDLLATPASQSTGVAPDQKPSLAIKRDRGGRIAVPYLTKEKVKCLDDVMKLLQRGKQNRATASTNLSQRSSRSHVILDVTVTSETAGRQNTGHLMLVDLAGSERVGKSGVKGKELKEARHINKSLSALGDVMEALERKASHVPYRNSKLTYLLKDCLGGNSRTMMIVTVDPGSESSHETQCALQFAIRVRRINLGAAQRNVSSKNQEHRMKQLMEEVETIRKEKGKYEEHLLALKRENKKMQNDLSSLKETRRNKHHDTSSLAVLRKSHNELVDRYEKEKAICRKRDADLNRCKDELRDVQHQLLLVVKERDQGKLLLEGSKKVVADTKKLYDEKEQALANARKELRATKCSLSAATVPTDRSKIESSSCDRSPPSVTTGGHLSAKSSALHVTKQTAEYTTCTKVASKDGEFVDIRERAMVLLQQCGSEKVERIDSTMKKCSDISDLQKNCNQEKEKHVHTNLNIIMPKEKSARKSRAEMAYESHRERVQRCRLAKKI